jgi:hypothetical protein
LNSCVPVKGTKLSACQVIDQDDNQETELEDNQEEDDRSTMKDEEEVIEREAHDVFEEIGNDQLARYSTRSQT